MEGVIAHEPAGAGGFGYDPILMLPEYGKTSAEITMDEKNAISHRGKALRAMKKCLAEEIGVRYGNSDRERYPQKRWKSQGTY